MFLNKVKACLELAERLYDIDLSNTSVNFTPDVPTGRAHDSLILEFNPLLVQNHYTRMVEIVIPHEVAHLVCYQRPELGCGHDHGFKQVLKNINHHWSLCY